MQRLRGGRSVLPCFPLLGIVFVSLFACNHGMAQSAEQTPAAVSNDSAAAPAGLPGVGTSGLAVAKSTSTGKMRLGPGDHFGEMGLLTGMASVARITALTPAVIYALS